MFWSDPNLYGVNFMYRDINTPVQTPVLGPTPPWQNLQRFVPPIYGFQPQPMLDPSLYASFMYRDINTPVPNPFLGQAISPWQNLPRFVPPVYGFQTPQTINPFMQQPFHMNLPLQNPYRPFPF